MPSLLHPGTRGSSQSLAARRTGRCNIALDVTTSHSRRCNVAPVDAMLRPAAAARLPLMAAFFVHGYTVLATALAPIGASTLALGSADGSKTVCSQRDAVRSLARGRADGDDG
jgi:hypothetical protein